MTDESKNSITMSKDTVYGGVIVVLLALLVLSVFTSGFGVVGAAPCVCPDNEDCPEVAAPVVDDKPDTTPPAEDALQQIDVDVGNLPALGQANAVVTLVQFSDYQCPFCARLYEQGEAQVKTNYINTGKAKFYFRDFPLSFHPSALPAAIATRCADDQGKFWEMHDKLFSEQDSWSGQAVDEIFKGYAADLGLDTATFNACYDADEHADEVNSDFVAGQSYGVRGTPSTFIIVPKNKITEAKMKAAISSLNSQYGDGIVLFENSNEYTVFIPGAYPYEAFDTVLKEVSY